METTFILDVAEHALRQLGQSSSVLLVNRKTLFTDFLEQHGGQYGSCSYRVYRRAMSKAFPIYKNNHKRFHYFKISAHVPRWALLKQGINLRPVAHMIHSGIRSAN